MPAPNPKAIQNRGSSLLSTLIALLVLMIALLSLGALQANAIRYGQGSINQAAIEQAALNLANAYKANPHPNHYLVSDLSALSTATPCSSLGCSAKQQATQDLLNFRQILQLNTSPEHPARATICQGTTNVSLSKIQCHGHGPLMMHIVWHTQRPGPASSWQEQSNVWLLAP